MNLCIDVRFVSSQKGSLILIVFITLEHSFCGSSHLYSHIILFVANLEWPMFQLDVKNTFHYGDIYRKVYIKQSPRHVYSDEEYSLQTLKSYLWI